MRSVTSSVHLGATQLHHPLPLLQIVSQVGGELQVSEPDDFRTVSLDFVPESRVRKCLQDFLIHSADHFGGHLGRPDDAEP